MLFEDFGNRLTNIIPVSRADTAEKPISRLGFSSPASVALIDKNTLEMVIST